MENQPVVIERTFDAPVSKVWSAISDKDEMKNWYFDLAEFRLEVGFEFRFYGGSEEQEYLHICEITKVVPERKLTYSWRYDGYSGRSFVSFELFPEGDKTNLKLTHSGLETFPKMRDFSKESFAAGWTEIIGSLLKNYLER